MTVGVYMIEHVATGRRYIGKSVNVARRARAHLSPTRSTKPSHLRNAVAKYGSAAFVWRLIEACPDNATALAREVHWIRTLGTRSPSGFNLTDGGEGMLGLSPTPETRKKIAASRRGWRHASASRAHLADCARGRPKSAETRRKLSVAGKGHKRNVGRPVSEETREKIRAGNLGKTVDSETRAKLSASHIGRRHSEATLEKMRAAQRRRRQEEKDRSNG